jgi:hypothetical protein
VTRPRTTIVTALALAAVTLLAVPAASTAKPHSRKHVHPGISIASFTAHGSNGWRIDVSAFTKFEGKPSRSVSLSAERHRGESVFYQGIKAKVTESGDIAAKLPGLGRIAVKFDQASEKHLHAIPEEGCTAKDETVSREGFVRGVIKFHGERGYTTVERRSAPARIIESPAEVCNGPKFTPAPEHLPGEKEATEQTKYFLAGRKIDNGQLTFSALSTGAPFASTDYSASYLHRRKGLFVYASTRAGGIKTRPFSLIAVEGTPTEAQMTPPAPFTGSGTFKLESPTKASWTGDLEVEVPTLGVVNLTAPGFWAGACAIHCTKTFPEGLRIGFGTSSSLPR